MLEKLVCYQSLFVTNVHWNASSLLFVWSDYLWSSICIFPVFIWETLTQIRIKEQSTFFLDLVLVNWPMKLINVRLSNGGHTQWSIEYGSLKMKLIFIEKAINKRFFVRKIIAVTKNKVTLYVFRWVGGVGDPKLSQKIWSKRSQN